MVQHRLKRYTGQYAIWDGQHMKREKEVLRMVLTSDNFGNRLLTYEIIPKKSKQRNE
jgi:hypothetical protein